MSSSATWPFAALLAAALSCCAPRRTWPPEPAPIRLGEDDCAGCKMIISDDRFAAEVETQDGRIARYDDLGCLLARETAGIGLAPPNPQGVFVRAFDGSGWLRGDVAIVVRARGIRSPMGYGFASFASRDAAAAEAKRHADSLVLPLATLLRDPTTSPTVVGDPAQPASRGVPEP